jgi:hypothetical protein
MVRFLVVKAGKFFCHTMLASQNVAQVLAIEILEKLSCDVVGLVCL